MTKTTRAPVRTLDDYGREIVRVPLRRGGDAIVDAADFDRLLRLGLTTTWFLNGNAGIEYVRAGRTTKGNLLGVARIIANAKPGEVVKYNDEDRTNLRWGNLYTKLGKAVRSDAAILSGQSVHRLYIKPPHVDPEATIGTTSGTTREASPHHVVE